jgi:MFS family permease
LHANSDAEPPQPEENRNFRLYVLNGAFVSMGHAFFAWNTVMAGLAWQLTGSNMLVGLLTSVAAAGMLWPQLLAGNRFEVLERKIPVYRAFAVVRSLSIGGMALSLLLFHDQPYLLYGLLLTGTAVLTSAGGVSLIPFMDVVAKAIPARRRAMLFALRRLSGGMLGFVAGVAAWYILSPRSGLSWPWNYALLLLAGFSFCTLAYAFFISSREPIQPVLSEAVSFTAFLRRGVTVFREDSGFRRFYYYRIFFHSGVMGLVLFVPFSMRAFDVPMETTGWFAAVIAITQGFSSIGWGALSRHYDETVLFRAGTAIIVIAPLTAAIIAILNSAGIGSAWLRDHAALLLVFMYICHTAGTNATGIAGTVYLLGLPPHRTPPHLPCFHEYADRAADALSRCRRHDRLGFLLCRGLHRCRRSVPGRARHRLPPPHTTGMNTG